MQSLFRECALLQLGLRWQLGFGFTLHSYNAKWLPINTSSSPILRNLGPYERPPSIASFITNDR
ncbi:hypothetical protein LINPERHAP2_LOCUS26259 [Linum perenne]